MHIYNSRQARINTIFVFFNGIYMYNGVTFSVYSYKVVFYFTFRDLYSMKFSQHKPKAFHIMIFLHVNEYQNIISSRCRSISYYLVILFEIHPIVMIGLDRYKKLYDQMRHFNFKRAIFLFSLRNEKTYLAIIYDI